MNETGRGHQGGILDHQDVLPRDLEDQGTQVYFVDIFQGEPARAGILGNLPLPSGYVS